MDGAGFIGSNLANRLAADNDVIALDDTYLGTPKNLVPEIEFVKADTVDEDFSVDIVFHLATLFSQNMHESDPQCDCRVNVEGFIHDGRRLGVPRRHRVGARDRLRRKASSWCVGRMRVNTLCHDNNKSSLLGFDSV